LAPFSGSGEGAKDSVVPWGRKYPPPSPGFVVIVVVVVVVIFVVV
jgi:hypothetical protein